MMSMYEKRKLSTIQDILEFDNEVKDKTEKYVNGLINKS